MFKRQSVNSEVQSLVNSERLQDSSGRKHIIEVMNVEKSFGDTHVLKDITFYIRENEFLTLLGPSGCGKTTTLRILGGFEDADSGQVTFAGQDLLKIPANERALNTVFQRYALFPYLNVYDNVAFGLRIKKVKEDEIKERVARALKMVDLDGYADREIDQLSGGQMQRVAIARAIINQPKILLLDEPLGALDLKMRKQMQVELKQMQRDLGITFVYVTHDQEEALTMSDTIIVMNDGQILQIGTPIDIYNEPKNAFVAQFIGESNILMGSMREDFRVTIEGREFVCVDPRMPEESVDVVIRPEDITICEPSDDVITGVLTAIIFKGVHYEMIVETKYNEWMIQSTDAATVGATVGLQFGPEDIHIMQKSIYSPDSGAEESISNIHEEGGANEQEVW